MTPQASPPLPPRRTRGAAPRALKLPPKLALALALLLVGLVAAFPALAQEGTTTEDGRELFVDTVDVDVVNLQVSVTDKDGKPIRGLTREDFVVEEDGDPVELTNFYAVESSMTVQGAGVDLEAGTPKLAELPTDQYLNLAVVIDNVNISPSNRKRALDQIREELIRVVRPGDRVMVGVLSPLPTIEQSFTDDLAAVNAALDRIGKSTSGNISLMAERRRIYAEFARSTREFGTPPPDGGLSPDSRAQPIDYARLALGRMESYGVRAYNDMRHSLVGIEALVASMSGLPGRKAVLFVSDGLSTNPVIELYTAFVDTWPEESRQLGVRSPEEATNRWELDDELQDLTRAAAASQVTFYTLDSRGARSALAGPDMMAPGAVGVGADLSAQATLVELAAATGGETMLNAANVASLLDTVSQDHSDYYSLGYVSDASRDGKFHRIKVRVPDVPGAKVRHTEGYRAKTAVEEMSDRTLSALVLDVADNPLDVTIELGNEQAEKRNRFVLPVLVKVPISNLVLIPQEKAHRGKITIFVAVQDDNGGLSEPQHFEVPVDIPNEQLLAAMSREVGYGVNLMVRSGPGKLAVGVRDEIAAVESTVNLNISIGQS